MDFKLVMTKGQVFKKGAEAHLSYGMFLDREVVCKIRKRKHYRHSKLDEQLRHSRTVREVKALTMALEHGVRVPTIYGIDLEAALIILEKINGPLLSQMIQSNHNMLYPALEALGKVTGLFHSCGLVHGDLTTYNAIWEENEGVVVLIDLGLADFSQETEQRATDLFTLLTTLKGIQPEKYGKSFESFLRGYKANVSFFQEVKNQLEDIALRGRYVSKNIRKKEVAWDYLQS
jgi:N6-L-threonylcarbamoyladenine synthase/protein kinase Bud32